jgi:hypothetical protein
MHAGEMETARHRLERGRHILEQQKKRIALMDAAGSASAKSKLLLKQMEQAVAEFEHQVELLQTEEEADAVPQPRRNVF